MFVDTKKPTIQIHSCKNKQNIFLFHCKTIFVDSFKSNDIMLADEVRWCETLYVDAVSSTVKCPFLGSVCCQCWYLHLKAPLHYWFQKPFRTFQCMGYHFADVRRQKYWIPWSFYQCNHTQLCTCLSTLLNFVFLLCWLCAHLFPCLTLP